MAIQTVFRRYELKYLLTASQKEAVLASLDGRMALDGYGRTTIRNLYFDTDNYRLIRASIEKPAYKEKLRIRSYRRIDVGEDVFVELKKKYKKVVYKRRLVMSEDAALDWLVRGTPTPRMSQIAEEIDYFRHFYATLAPRVFLSYEREAFAPIPNGETPPDFRLTFDENILARTDRLSLTADPGGTPLLLPDMTLMEIKTGGGIPLWMVDILTREQLYKTSFSKYGTFYQNHILHQKQIERATP